MNKNEQKFEEQDHPLKNTDNAFVQVGKNGEPVVPHTAENNESGQKDDDTSRVVYDKP